MPLWAALYVHPDGGGIVRFGLKEPAVTTKWEVFPVFTVPS